VSDDLQRDFAELARTLKDHLRGTGLGFALLMQLEDGKYHYASVAHRDDAREMLAEWLALTEAAVNVRDPSETQPRIRERVALEAQCAELGLLLNACGHRAVLFLFDFGDGGHLAWHSSAPDPKGVVRNFLKVTEGT
jgi:hypothetical protein